MPSAPENRFDPGSIVSERYRIVALLGRGGMGEVYRADDLRLGQQVALKFLPSELGDSPEHLQRFLDEVRVARQVSHPNVCRVHDIGEVDGQSFISMEYVGGEDLAGLLHRIGRLPQDKAVEIAHQMCAGLAAAHSQGILHRDLKPANVMLDSAGNVRIADFGLAAVASSLRREDARVGTPAYMAPEQLAGEDVSVRSDVFSLGLVLFELFTGRRAFDAKTLDELLRLHSETSPTPSGVLPDIDPVTDAVIRRCLARDPKERPGSAREVAAGLPGGDPLAAALAAGETPSPELVAAAGGSGLVRPGVAGAWVAFIIVALLAIGWFSRQQLVVEVVHPELPPEVLEHQARETARLLGWSSEGGDDAMGIDQQVPEAIARDPAPDKWQRLRHPSANGLLFWYRYSPHPLVSENRKGRVQWNRPPSSQRGMFKLALGSDGRLVHFEGWPRLGDHDDSVADWAPTFAAAGLDMSSFEAADLPWVPSVPGDVLRAWAGPHPDFGDAKVEVFAASFHGRPTQFSVNVRWQMPRRERTPSAAFRGALFDVSALVVSLIMLVGGLWFAARNLLQGRGDRRNATRIAIYLFALGLLGWGLQAHHVSDGNQELQIAMLAAAWSVWNATIAWFLYVGLEPTVRSTWPHKLVSWNRLLAGRFGDAMIGRDVLLGVATGAVFVLLTQLNWACVAPIDGVSPAPNRIDADLLFGPSDVIASLLANHIDAGFSALLVTFLLVFFRRLVRSLPVALAVLMLIALARMPYYVQSELPWLDLAFRAVEVGVMLWLLVRAGVVSMLCALFVMNTTYDASMVPDFGTWYSGPGLATWIVLLGLTGYGFWSATRRAPAVLTRK